MSKSENTESERCDWCKSDPLYIAYHDTEWGVPLHDDTRLFEMLSLESAQAGLSWITILRKRENYRAAFNGFDPVKVARYSEKKIASLLENPGIIRNRAKIASVVRNAREVLAIQDQLGSLDHYFWQWVEGKPIQNKWRNLKEIPARTTLSEKLSKDLQRRGLNFVGPTICYALMQSIGMVNDHLITCPRYGEVKRLG
jgi:DNA-3-methyladenine glycosylase I